MCQLSIGSALPIVADAAAYTRVDCAITLL